MPIVYILATFACMLAAVALVLVAFYSAINDLWAGAALAGALALLAFVGMDHFIGKVEDAYQATLAAQMKGNTQ